MASVRPISIALLALVCLVALCGCSSEDVPPAPSATPHRLVWADDFNGPAGTLPDATKWNFVTGGKGWGNNELECYTNVPGNVSDNGVGDLVITAIRQPGHICSDGAANDFTSARINTQNKFTVRYGRIEVRAKVPTASGTWPAFWALGSNIPEVGWPTAGEIDIMEVIGREPTIVHGTLHGPKPDGSHYSVERTIDTGSNLDSAFHVYGVDWSPTSITFTLDGRSYGTVTRTDVERAGGKWVMAHSFYLLLNLAVGGDYPGTPLPSTTWPQTYAIDYVRVYS